jgi:hypothetical protein
MPRVPFYFAIQCIALAACPGANDGPNDDGVDAREVDAVEVAPETTLTVTPASLSNRDPARFEFVADREATFTCSVDGRSAVACASPYLIGLDDGPHTLEVTAVGVGGIADPTPARHEWTIDTLAPNTTFQVAPALLDNSTSTRFEFTAAEEATFRCSLDGLAATDCVSPHLVTGLFNGEHRLSVVATDAAGNVELTPAVHAWIVDTFAPDTQITSGPDGAVASLSATFTFSSSEIGAGMSFECALDGAPWATCTSPRQLTSLTEGAHSFQVRVRDAVGNIDPTPARRDWIVDITPPGVTIVAPPSPTSDTTPVFGFTVTGLGPGWVSCRFDSNLFAPCTSPHAPSVPLAEGTHTFQVRVSDAAANSSTATSTITIDTIAPVVTIAPVMSPTNNATPTFTFTVDESAATDCRFDTGTPSACVSPQTPPVALSDGTHDFQVRATDLAGNTSSATSTVVIESAMGHAP